MSRMAVQHLAPEASSQALRLVCPLAIRPPCPRELRKSWGLLLLWPTHTGSPLDARNTLYRSHEFPRGIPAIDDTQDSGKRSYERQKVNTSKWATGLGNRPERANGCCPGGRQLRRPTSQRTRRRRRPPPRTTSIRSMPPSSSSAASCSDPVMRPFSQHQDVGRTRRFFDLL